MLKEETIKRQDNDLFEEPSGEFLELVRIGSNSLTVLTRVDTGKVAVESPPVDPSDLTVSELEKALEDDDYDWNKAALRGLLEAEREGDNRATAISAINDQQ